MTRSYLDNLGTGLNKLVLGEFAPAEERFESLKARLEAIPSYLDTAMDNIDPAEGSAHLDRVRPQ